MTTIRLLILVLGVLTVLGCTKPPPPLAPTKPAEVIVDKPVLQEVRDYEEFTGRTESVNAVEIRAQVTGELVAVHFKDGTDVTEGAPLFEIDPRPYQAAAEQARGVLAVAKARLDRITREYERKTRIPGAISEDDKERVTGEKAEAEAAVTVAEAAKKLAETNLAYTKIVAKFSGRISRRMVDPGNIVKANETMLTTLVVLDPIYAAFDVDTNSLLRVRRLILGGKATSARELELKVQIGLPDEDGYPHTGTVTFIDNRVDANTGTLRIRATLDNPKNGTDGKRYLMSPGLFIRVRVPIGPPRPGLLVPEEAVGSEQGQKVVFVVTDKDEVDTRRVEVGPQVGTQRVIEKGITPNDRVIVSGLQRVRRGSKVTAKPVESAKPVLAAGG
jgi:RND family efflux transporter MFP subunit